jgi:hypothetical protein
VDSGGGHYKIDPSSTTADQTNEIWPGPFTTDGDGVGRASVQASHAARPDAQSVVIHDELCKLEGPKSKDGVGHCPTMMWFKGESHMSEVFSFGSIDKIVSDQVLAFVKQHH